LRVLAGISFNDSALKNTQTSPIEPMIVARILSDAGIGCTQASVNIVKPPKPNSTIKNMSKVLSVIAIGLPSFLV